MSAVKAYEFLQKRLDALGLSPASDFFSSNNTPASAFGSTYHLQFRESNVTEVGNKSLIVTHGFTLYLLLRGWQRDLQSIKEAYLFGEKVLNELCNPEGFASDNILSVIISSYSLLPFDENDNDDKLLFEVTFGVKNALCIN